jgi:surfeit locus 1 family protein
VKKRDIAFGIFGLIFAIVCIRLGIWQLQRLSDRKHLNTELRSRAATRPVDLAALPKDTGEAHFRRVVISGTYDYDHEITLTNRSRNGSPGVNIITPLRGMSDTAILVNRGWVYAPDGMTVDLARWRETSSMNGDGYVEFFRKGNGTAKSATHERAYRWVDDSLYSLTTARKEEKTFHPAWMYRRSTKDHTRVTRFNGFRSRRFPSSERFST